RAVAEERPNLGPAVVGTRLAPRGPLPGVLVEVDPALAVLRPAVELPQVEIGRPEMVVDDVQDHRDPGGMSVADERLQVVRSAVVALDREGEGRVVAPRAIARELERRHQLDRADPEILEIREAASNPL